MRASVMTALASLMRLKSIFYIISNTGINRIALAEHQICKPHTLTIDQNPLLRVDWLRIVFELKSLVETFRNKQSPIILTGAPLRGSKRPTHR